MIEAVRILIYLRPTQLKRGPTQNENLVQIKCTPKHSAICFQFLQKWIQNTTSRDMNSFFQRPEFLLLSPRAEKSAEVFRKQKLFWRKAAAFQRSAFGRSTTGNDVVATIFIRFFFPPPFFSVATFSHRRSARIKKLI